eukprot:COSAG02_NODE_38641_length_427_cov_0.564024_1_plen_85_part_00
MKDLHLDKVHDEPDAKVATLIRTQLVMLIKGNLTTMWPLASAAALMNSNVVGKEIDMVKNNDLLQNKSEDIHTEKRPLRTTSPA